jgi:hypothetical protein
MLWLTPVMPALPGGVRLRNSSATSGALTRGVIVVQWAELLVRATERDWGIPDMKACGQALEYLLHCHFRPAINCYARTTDGRYHERPPERSKAVRTGGLSSCAAR